MPLYPPVSTGSSAAVPQVVAAGTTYTIPTNTQVTFANQILTNNTAIVLTTGTAAITFVD